MKKSEKYQWQALVIITFLMLLSIGIIYISSDGFKLILTDFISYISKNFSEFIVSICFIALGIYGWDGYITNMLIKPKKDVLYLLELDEEIDTNICTFIDRKGKKYQCNSAVNKPLTRGAYYNIMKTRDEISNIQDQSTITFPIIEKNKSNYTETAITKISNETVDKPKPPKDILSIVIKFFILDFSILWFAVCTYFGYIIFTLEAYYFIIILIVFYIFDFYIIYKYIIKHK